MKLKVISMIACLCAIAIAFVLVKVFVQAPPVLYVLIVCLHGGVFGALFPYGVVLSDRYAMELMKSRIKLGVSIGVALMVMHMTTILGASVIVDSISQERSLVFSLLLSASFTALILGMLVMYLHLKDFLGEDAPRDIRTPQDAGSDTMGVGPQ